MRGRILGPIALVIVAACGGTGPVPSTAGPSLAAVETEMAASSPAGATVTPTTASPTGAPTLEPTPSDTPPPDPTSVPTENPPCPTVEPLTVEEFRGAELQCFGSDDYVIHAWLDTPPAFGFLPPEIKPGWLAYPPDSRFIILLASPPPQGDPGSFDGLLVHLTPDSDVVLDGPARWVLATGHRRDPASTRCHYVIPPEWEVGTLDDADARATCRHSFVLVALEDAPPP